RHRPWPRGPAWLSGPWSAASARGAGRIPTMLDIALKEWAVICELLLTGELAILLRKGGIHERGGPGVFELEHPRFVLYPSWAHQKPGMLKPPFAQRVEVMTQEPAQVTFEGIGEAARIWKVPSRP